MNNHEILFLYDGKNFNPNGAPENDNLPRFNQHTLQVTPSHFFIKRIVRDYLLKNCSKDIFVKTNFTEDGSVADCKAIIKKEIPLETLNELKSNNKNDKLNLNAVKNFILDNLTNKYIDLRLFGGMITFDYNQKTSGSIKATGPIQVGFGHSLHQVELMTHGITSHFSSGEAKNQSTMGEFKCVPYALISYYFKLNAQNSIQTQMTEEDFKMFLDGLWFGIQEKSTTSKNGIPRLLIDIESSYRIGDLDDLVVLNRNEDLSSDFAISSFKDYNIELSKLAKTLIDKYKYFKTIDNSYNMNINLRINSLFNCEVDNFKKVLENEGVSVSLVKI